MLVVLIGSTLIVLRAFHGRFGNTGWLWRPSWPSIFEEVQGVSPTRGADR